MTHKLALAWTAELSLDHKVHLLHIEVLTIAKAPGAICFIAIKTEETIFVRIDSGLTSHALNGLLACVWTYHPLTSLKLRAALVPVDTILPIAQSEALLRSSEPCQVIRQILNYILFVFIESLDVHITKALVIGKLCSVKVTFANLALNDNFWTVSLNMLEQLRSSHMLVILTVADVTAILGAIVNGMLLQLSHGLPDDNLTAVLPALVRELAEINTVLEHLVDWLKEVTSLSTAWATLIVALWHFISFSGGSSVDRGNVLLSLLNRQSFEFFFWNHLNSWIGKIVLIMWCCATHHLGLAVLTKQLVALSAFSWQQWSSTADDTLDFFNHLFL